MSTRGAVAWVDKNTGEWKGVYNHSDSYPTWLGKAVFEACAKLGMENVISRLKQVGDWREFESGGVCEYCGKVAGQPHSISGALVLNRVPGQFPDPEAKHHEHGDGVASQFDPRQDPLFMEWVYLLRPETQTIEVYKSAQVKPTHPGAQELEHSPGTYYGHFFVVKLTADKALIGDDALFADIEAKAEAERDKHDRVAEVAQNRRKGPRYEVKVTLKGRNAKNLVERIQKLALDMAGASLDEVTSYGLTPSGRIKKNTQTRTY